MDDGSDIVPPATQDPTTPAPAPAAPQAQDISLADLPDDVARTLPYNHPLLDAHADAVSQQIGLPGLVTAIKNAGEKSGSGSVSPKGAQGVMQFMPGTAKRYGLTDPTNPVQAINAAGKYLADIASKLGTKDPALIAAAYNAGENRKDIQAGKIPLIPETQKYVQRVKGYMETRGAQAPSSSDGVDPADLPDAPAAGGAGGVDPSDLPGDSAPTTQDDVIRKYASAQGPQVNSTTGQAAQTRHSWIPGMTTYHVGPKMANFLAMVDQNVADPVIGGATRAKNFINQLTGSNVFDLSQDHRDAATVGKYNAPIASTPEGVAGSLVGSGIDSALTWGLGGGPLSALATGALSGYTMPAGSEEEAAQNAGVGAILGPLGYAGGKAVNKLAQPVMDRVMPLVNKAIPDLGRFSPIRPSIGSQLPAAQRDAVNTALDQKIPVWSKQVTDPGLEITEGQQAKQQSGFDRAISRSIGQNTDDANLAWRSAHDDLSGQYRQLLDNKQIPLGIDHMADISDLINRNNSRLPRFPANPEVQDSLERAFQAAQQGPISGTDLQAALRNYRGQAGDLFKAGDPHSGKIMLDLANSLEGQASNALGPQELQKYHQLNTQWRNMTQLQSVVPKDLNASLDPRAVANRLATARRGEFLYGDGDQTLPNLAHFGATYMSPKKPATGLWAESKRFAGKALPLLAADVGGGAVAGSMMNGGDPWNLAADITQGLPVAGGAYLGLRALRNGRAGPQLTREILNQMRGPVPSVVRNAATPGALTRAYIESTHGDE